jgi:NAD(P)H dehydrogenase (quinone)
MTKNAASFSNLEYGVDVVTRISKVRLVSLLLFIAINAPSLFGQNVVIVYYSEQGHTKAMADAVAKGARTSEDAKVRLLSVDKATDDDLLWADAVIVGSPVHSANVAAPIQKFLSHMPWEQKMKDKVGAAFVTGGGLSAGEELAQINILHSMLIYNMIVVGGPTWNQAFGASGVTEEEPFIGQTNPKFLAKGEALGKRVADIAKRLRPSKK